MITPSIDCTGLSRVFLEFTHLFAYSPGNDIVRVDVSNDGGQTWTNVWELFRDKFAVGERIRPGINRRATEISKIMEWALEPVLLIDKYANIVIDVHVNIIQADAGTRCAAINAAAMALAHAGIPMKNIVSSIAAGKLDKTVVLDLDKYEDSEFEEGEGSTDIPMTFTPDGKLTHIQVDGKINKDQLLEAIKMAREAAKEIYEVQKKALKDSVKPEETIGGDE